MAGPNLEIVADTVKSMQCPGCKDSIDVSACPPFSQVKCPHCEAVARVPAQLGSFLLLETLGRGGMGAVYKARDLTLNRHVAIKVLRKEYGDDGQFLSSFLHEARAAAALNHRNVAQIYSYGQEKGQPYIVMELLEAGRLDKMIEGEEPLDETFVMSTAVHIVEGLQAANDIGLIHGDIKPANILFDEKGVAKVVDFGLAQFSASQQERPAEVWGTPYYIAPEKARGKSSDHRADIYSLGGTLFHALAKTAPFEGATAKDVVRARLEAPAPRIREYRPDITAETEATISRMLERSTNRRYPTYVSLLSDLNKASRAAQKAARERIREKAEAAAAADLSARRKPMRLLTVFTLIVALLAGGAWWWYQHSKPPERKIARYILTGGKLIPVYEDELEAQGATALGVGPADAVPDPPSPSAGEVTLLQVAEALSAGEVRSGAETLAGLVAELEAADPVRAQAQLLQGITCWMDGRPEDAQHYLGTLPDAAPDSVRSLAAYLSGSGARTGLDAGRESWATGPRVITDFVMGLASLHQGEVDRALDDFDRYAQAASTGWWTGLQPWVPRLRVAIEDWQAQAPLLPADRLTDAVSQIRGFSAATMTALRPMLDLEIAARERDLRNRTAQASREEQARDRQRVEAAVDAVELAVGEERYAEAAATLTQTLASLETADARSRMETEQRRLKRLVSVRAYLAEQLTASPPTQRIPALGGRISGASTDAIFMARIDGGGEKSWKEVPPALYLKLLDFYIQQPSLETPDRADMALSIAYYWHTQQRDRTALRYGRLALRLDPQLQDEAEALMPTLDVAAPPAAIPSP